MKPTISTDISANTEAVARVVGPELAQWFVPNPSVKTYAAVLHWPNRCVVSGELKRALARLDEPPGPLLLAGRDFTVEARQIAADANCDILSVIEFGWTDESVEAIKTF